MIELFDNQTRVVVMVLVILSFYKYDRILPIWVSVVLVNKFGRQHLSTLVLYRWNVYLQRFEFIRLHPP
jgi:hypothetical protein